MKIIDFARKGNVVRFFLGADDLKDWHGDDWNDTPYEHNAGEVYDEFVSGHIDIAFAFDKLVLEPCDGVLNSDYCKDDTTVAYSEHDIYITPDAGNILVAPNGTRYRLKVANDGTLSTQAVN